MPEIASPNSNTTRDGTAATSRHAKEGVGGATARRPLRWHFRLRQFLTAQRDGAQDERVLWAATIRDTPERAVPVLANEKSAVMRHRHADGTRPNSCVVGAMGRATGCGGR
jgi:hypothetical protein